MIQNYEGRRKANSLIIATEKAITDDYDIVLNQLTLPTTDDTERVTAEQPSAPGQEEVMARV